MLDTSTAFIAACTLCVLAEAGCISVTGSIEHLASPACFFLKSAMLPGTGHGVDVLPSPEV